MRQVRDMGRARLLFLMEIYTMASTRMDSVMAEYVPKNTFF